MRKGAKFFLASTSEVYGDPLVNPQPETYWGNVNPIGPRGVYDEAKRFAEAMTLAYNREHGVDTRIVRIFNTYGPRMRADDGRAVPAFFKAALQNRPLPVFGDGSQTRSLCYVDDEVEGILRLLLSDETGPVNIGNPEEVTMLELAETVQDVVGNHPGIEFHADRPTIPWSGGQTPPRRSWSRLEGPDLVTRRSRADAALVQGSPQRLTVLPDGAQFTDVVVRSVRLVGHRDRRRSRL